MNVYVTGPVIKRLREAKAMTQAELAEQIGVSSKAVSKWETARGLPDVSLLEPLSQALGVSVTELLSGAPVSNQNTACNMLRTKLYVCPVCGNILHATGEAVISCCGIPLPPLEAEDPDEDHRLQIEPVEDEQFLTVRHPMTKTHFLSFLAYVTSDRFQLVKLYPEGNAEARFSLRGAGYLYVYCNRHGLMKQKYPGPTRKPSQTDVR
ncbi:MAG: helix-turn-helix domain-containing protein [Candidatus Avoscillospira sp.]